MGEIMFERIALVGIGLIGSSIARDIKELGLARHVTISTRSAETLKRAEELALGSEYTTSAAQAVRDADLVIVSVPVGSSGAVAEQMAPHLKPGAIVTDVGSTKASVIAQMAPHMPDNVHFIPGHPLAGTEKSGPDAGFPVFSASAGASSRRCRARMRRRWKGSRISGGRSVRASMKWMPNTTTRFWRSSRICRTSSPTTSSARRMIWRR